MIIELDFAFDAGTVYDALDETLDVAGLTRDAVAPQLLSKPSGNVWPTISFEAEPAVLVQLLRAYEGDQRVTEDDLRTYAVDEH